LNGGQIETNFWIFPVDVSLLWEGQHNNPRSLQVMS